MGNGYELWFGDEPERNKEMYYDKVTHIKEVAYHEAGHFVFKILNISQNLGFNLPKEMKIVMEEEICDGNVRADKPFKVVKYSPEESDKLELAFYKENPLRFFGQCMELMAGFVSRLVFIDQKDDYFIGGHVDPENQKKLMFYYSIKTVYRYSNISDYNELRRLFNLIEFENEGRQIFLEKCHETVLEVYKQKSVVQSMGYVKNKFIRNVNSSITGKYLNEMVDEVSNYTKNFSNKEHLRKLKLFLSEYDQNLF